MTGGALTLQGLLSKRLREVRIERGLSQDDLARAMGSYGFRWAGATVAAIETGRRNLSIEEVLVLPLLLGCELAQLLDDPMNNRVALNEQKAVLTQALRGVVTGLAFQVTEDMRRPLLAIDRPSIDEDVRHALKVAHAADEGLLAVLVDLSRRQEAERKAAKSLGISAAEVATYSLYLWSRGLTEEREHRLTTTDEVALNEAALRGHITRTLLKELRDLLKKRESIEKNWSPPNDAFDVLGLPEVYLDRLRSIPLDEFAQITQQAEEESLEDQEEGES